MNIRPFTDRLRWQYGRRSFVRAFDTTAGGGARHVRLCLLFDGDGECDSRRTHAFMGDRWVEVDLHEDGRHRASHFLVTDDCVCSDQGPRMMRSSTRPTPFWNPDDMIAAVEAELRRTDHGDPA